MSDSYFSSLFASLCTPRKSGYTLVELLIVITLTTILITIGISAYRKAADSQAIKAATETIMGTLTAAQKAATSGKNDCTGAYLGETVSVTNGSGTITTTSTCEGSSGTPRPVTLTNFTFSQTLSLIFRPLNQGVITGATDPAYLDYSSAGSTYRIQINRSGTITSLGKVVQ